VRKEDKGGVLRRWVEAMEELGKMKADRPRKTWGRYSEAEDIRSI